jgi:hypothetical protein
MSLPSRGGTLIADTFVFAGEFYEHFGRTGAFTSSHTTSPRVCR